MCNTKWIYKSVQILPVLTLKVSMYHIMSDDKCSDDYVSESRHLSSLIGLRPFASEPTDIEYLLN